MLGKIGDDAAGQRDVSRFDSHPRRCGIRRVLVEASPTTSPALQEILEAARGSGVPVSRVPARQLDQIHPRHQGVAVEVEDFRYVSWAEVLQVVRAASQSALVLALDQVQ